ncbi:hypothetical protein BDQ17DRAFT_1045652 [Cyathus striatus]|nr:hypothetical protein BDQ17DRAFT_1045652 [Cyathus striatus]
MDILSDIAYSQKIEKALKEVNERWKQMAERVQQRKMEYIEDVKRIHKVHEDEIKMWYKELGKFMFSSIHPSTKRLRIIILSAMMPVRSKLNKPYTSYDGGGNLTLACKILA